ncbi:MAG: terminase [Alphaproteobacteria bacterium]
MRAAATDEERAWLDQAMTAEPWLPIPGPQVMALNSQADVLLYGGAAGGGKTDLLLGLALSAHRRSIIFRRDYGQLRPVLDRMEAILGSRKGWSEQARAWRLGGGRVVEFGACHRAGSELAFQGRAHDLKAFDEITHFTEAQFRFLGGWLRTPVEGQRCRVVAAGNPPTGDGGDWILSYWGPWLDPRHPNPAQAGELRWYAVIDGEDEELESGTPFTHKGEMIVPVARSFVPSRVEDNPYLMASGYKATLQALPEPLRSLMLEGEFAGSARDDPWQIIPGGWIAAAQDRWREMDEPDMPMTALGLDVARGGRDRTVLSPRRGRWFAPQHVYPGSATPDGPSVMALVLQASDPGTPVHLDIIGVGGSVYGHLKAHGVPIVSLNGSEVSHQVERSRLLRFANRRAEWWWRLREALDPVQGEALALPPDAGLAADLSAPRWKLTARGIQVESKESIRKRAGRSPDRGDAIVYAWAAGSGHLPSEGLLW